MQAAVDPEFADRRFVPAGPLLDHRDRALHRAAHLEEAQHDHCIGEIGHVDRRLHVAHHSRLRHGEIGRHAVPVQELKDFVHVQDQRVLLRHGSLVAVQAVDDDRPNGRILHATRTCARTRRATARRRRAAMMQLAAVAHRREVEAQRLGAVEQQAELLVEDEHRGLARRAIACRRTAGDEALARAGRPSSSVLDPARCRRPAAIEALMPEPTRRARICCGARPPPAAGRPARRRADDEVVVAAAERLGAILDHAQARAARAVVGRHLLEPQHAVGDAVHRLVQRVGRQVVEHQHGRAVAREIVLQCQDLPAVAQRALAEQADFRQRVEHDALGPCALDRLEDQLGGFAQLEVGRIEQALLLICIEQALGRRHLEDLDLVAEVPAMRRRRRPQLVRRFR
jgi:hypothetical protein